MPILKCAAAILLFCTALSPAAHAQATGLVTETGQVKEEYPDVSEYGNVKEGLMIPPEPVKPPPPPNQGLPGRLGESPGVFEIPGLQEKEAEALNVMSIEQIMKSYEKGDYAVAVKALQPLVQTKQHVAEELLGVMYAQGQGVEKDYKKAMELLALAAEANRPLAQHYLGAMYSKGQGLDAPDLIRGLMWLHIAILHYHDGPEKERAKMDRDAIYVQATRLEKNRAQELARAWMVERGKGYLMDIRQ